MALHSRDEQSVLVVSYSDLKDCLEKTFMEVLSSSGTPSPSSSSGGDAGTSKLMVNGHRPARGPYSYGNPS